MDHFEQEEPERKKNVEKGGTEGDVLLVGDGGVGIMGNYGGGGGRLRGRGGGRGGGGRGRGGKGFGGKGFGGKKVRGGRGGGGGRRRGRGGVFRFGGWQRVTVVGNTLQGKLSTYVNGNLCAEIYHSSFCGLYSKKR